MLKWLCKLIGHNWKYFAVSGKAHIKVCPRCVRVDQHRDNVPVYGTGYFRLIQFKKPQE